MDFDFKPKKKDIPFDFVLEQLESIQPIVKPMFGCHAVYYGEKIILILRDKEDFTDDNGVWLATLPEHHESLRQVFPNMRSLGLFGADKPTSWQNLPASSDDFEESVTLACEMILARDPRIGKISARKARLHSARKARVNGARKARSDRVRKSRTKISKPAKGRSKKTSSTKKN